jgi:hypothetical protein
MYLQDEKSEEVKQMQGRVGCKRTRRVGARPCFFQKDYSRNVNAAFSHIPLLYHLFGHCRSDSKAKKDTNVEARVCSVFGMNDVQ